ncbi:MAG: cysteine--tRNA ligase [Rickettsiaceae bacterium]|nr:cysteine--tRNA ligase [Rickettsiaceae bacterium]MDP4833014.1 cysteine--tRNA ligase [Rickettsiaceae bacterium]MDP5020633.1 cysteine--tRNA ligase [Rickettsiaceae bacterium]MDP5083022.1 cysteine--tRNA ligase [Rickettsiaceae bacterium]
MKLLLYNSLARKKEIFLPIDTNLVKMYVCGPTVYDRPHIGNARSVVIYDTLYRILIKIYGKKQVLYVRNITDIDDKIIVRAAQDKIAISELTQKTTEYFHSDMDYLACLRPNIEPKATDHVQEMIDIISKLLANDVAYKADEHIYFDVTKYSNYNKLSGRSFEEMFQGVRVDNSDSKRNPNDFVLWKPALESDDQSAKFISPFGIGRPGWHIECSAMSHKYLGETFDIHGGGADLIFPHHTNEIAQSCAAFPGSEFAKTWVHNGFLTVNHEKMSKSLNNFVTVQDLITQGVKGEVVRLFLLSNHYRKPIDYNEKAILDANRMISYWYRAIEDMEVDQLEINQELPENFVQALLQDLNTHNAIKITNDYAKQVYTLANNKQKVEAANNMLTCARFLGLMPGSARDWFQTIDNKSQVDQLIVDRAAAKQAKNWSLADSIRDQLSEMGVVIEDKSDGSTSWKKQT